MHINSKEFGKIKIDNRQKIHFPKGIIGFEDFKDFALIDSSKAPFFWLQNLNEVSLAFILISPYIFCKNYDISNIKDDFFKLIDIDVKDDTLKEIQENKCKYELLKQDLNNQSNDDILLVFCIVTIPYEREQEMTANLKGPIIVNKKNKKAFQAIQEDDIWKVKHKIIR